MGNDKRVRKPEWLKISIGANERYTETKRIVESHCTPSVAVDVAPTWANAGEKGQLRS